MRSNDSAYGWFVGKAAMGMLCCVLGLYLASLSNPRQYSISASDDKYIYGCLLAGLTLTLLGVGVFLRVMHSTTSHMPAEIRREVNLGVGAGFAMQGAGFLAAAQWPDAVGLAWAILILGLAVFTWGTMKYAVGKGCAKAYGLFGILGVAGLVILILLPEREAKSQEG